MRKVANADEEFKYAPADNDLERNRKETQKMLYSSDRFLMSKMYLTKDPSILTDSAKLTTFIKGALQGELPLYWESEPEKKEKYTTKIVGEDFEKRVMDNKRDALILITHPIKEKNRGLDILFE